MTDQRYDRIGADGQPICDEVACRTWGCWCDRALGPECEHGNHPLDCQECNSQFHPTDEDFGIG